MKRMQLIVVVEMSSSIEKKKSSYDNKTMQSLADDNPDLH